MGKDAVMCSEHPKTQMICPECDGDQLKSLVASEAAKLGPKVITLSDVARDQKGRINLAALGTTAVLSMAVVQAANAETVALSEVAAAITAGKIAPAKRDAFEKIALSDIESFRTVLAGMPDQVDLSEHGLGGGGEGVSEIDRIDDQLGTLAAARATKDGIGFGAAMKLVASENSELSRRRVRLQRSVKASGEGDE